MSQPPTSRTTRGLRAGLGGDPTHRSVVPPLYLTTNYAFDGLDERGAYDYSRSANPTRDVLADAMATLEGGAGAVVTGTGMGAITLCLNAFVPTGGRVVAPLDCYGGTWRLLSWLADKGALVADLVDLTDVAAAREALSSPADLVLVETPSNPLLRITDLAATSELAHAAGALLVADNTFCSPLLQRPLELGADLVVHSTTKFVNGHSDVVGGACIARTEEQSEQLLLWANCLGLTAGAFDSYLTLRGLRTLDARLRVHQENTARVLELLLGHPAALAVHHPGLPDHPGHAVAARQQPGGFGSLLSLELAGGRPAVEAFVAGLQVALLAESLGGVETLVCHPASMTHLSMPPAVQQAAGITEGLVRLSVGIEPAGDLLADLSAALDRAHRAR